MPSQDAKGRAVFCSVHSLVLGSALEPAVTGEQKRSSQMDAVWEEAWEAWGSATSKAKLSSEERTVGPRACSRSALSVGTQVTSLPVSHLVLRELSEKHAAIPQYLIPYPFPGLCSSVIYSDTPAFILWC